MSNLFFYQIIYSYLNSNSGLSSYTKENLEKLISINLLKGEVLYFLVDFVHEKNGHIFIILSNFGKLISFGSQKVFTIEDFNIKLPLYLIDNRILKSGGQNYSKEHYKDTVSMINSYKNELGISDLQQPEDKSKPIVDVNHLDELNILKQIHHTLQSEHKESISIINEFNDLFLDMDKKLRQLLEIIQLKKQKCTCETEMEGFK